ncbi:MAG: PilX N-terminal domain-containing pilus assembly protein [Pseudomonadota bacterium]
MSTLRQVTDGTPLAEHGVALLVALLMLIAVLLIGASAARMAMQGEKAARAERDRQVAFQAAEDALGDAQRDIDGGAAIAPERAALFAPGDAPGFAEGCGSDPAGFDLGLCARAAGSAAPIWQLASLDADDEAASGAVPYGRFTGATMETGQAFLPFRQPRYIIERLPYRHPGDDAAGPPRYYFRITAIGFGARPSTQVVLQSGYRKADDAGAP